MNTHCVCHCMIYKTHLSSSRMFVHQSSVLVNLWDGQVYKQLIWKIELAKFCKINDRILHPLPCKGVWTEKFMIDWSFCEWSDFFLWNNLDYDEFPINVYFIIALGKVTNNISLSNILLMAQFPLLAERRAMVK